MRMISLTWFAMLAVACAGLTFPEALKEVQASADVEKVTADFEFTNQSDKPVTVTNSDAACSCMSVGIAGGKMRYEPGESGVVRAVFDMGTFSGTVDKVVLLWFDNAPEDKPSQTLTVRVHIPVLVEVTPKTLKWEVGGNAETQTIEIRMNHEKPIHVKSVNASTEAFVQELKTIEEGKHYQLLVTPRDIDSPALGIFRIETDCEISKHRIQQVFGVIRNATP